MTKSSTTKVQSMATYVEIQKQIKKLQAEGEEQKKLEVEDCLGEMKAKIELYGITAEQLGFGKPAPEASTPASAYKGTSSNGGVKSVLPAKYKNPNGPGTWAGGRGNRPKWVKMHLDAGRALEELLIEK